MEWQENAFRIHTFVKDVRPTPPRIGIPDLHGSGLIASKPALVYSARKRTDEVGLLRQSVSVCKVADS